MPAPRPHQHTYTPPPAPTNTHTPLPPPPPTHIHPSPRTPGRKRWVVMHACSHLQRQQRGVATSRFILFSTSTRGSARCACLSSSWSYKSTPWCSWSPADDLRCLVSDSRWREVFTRYVSGVRQPMTWGVHSLCVWCQKADDVRCSLVMCLLSDSRWREVFTRYVSSVRQPMTWDVHSLCVWCQKADDVRCSLVMCLLSDSRWRKVFTRYVCCLGRSRQLMTWGVHSCLLSDSRWREVFTRCVCCLVSDSRWREVFTLLSCIRQLIMWGVHSLCVHCLVSDSRWREVFTRCVSTVWCQTVDDVLVMCLLTGVRQLMTWGVHSLCVHCLVSDSRWCEMFTRYVSSVRQPMTWGVWCQTADDVRCSLVRCLVVFATRLPSAPTEAAPRGPVTWERRVQKVGSRVLDPGHALQQWNVTPVRGARLKWAYVYTVYVYGTLDTERC